MPLSILNTNIPFLQQNPASDAHASILHMIYERNNCKIRTFHKMYACVTMCICLCVCVRMQFQPSCCWTKGLGIASMPSWGQMSTTEVPLHTTNPNCRVSSVSFNWSSGSGEERRVKYVCNAQLLHNILTKDAALTTHVFDRAIQHQV